MTRRKVYPVAFNCPASPLSARLSAEVLPPLVGAAITTLAKGHDKRGKWMKGSAGNTAGRMPMRYMLLRELSKYVPNLEGRVVRKSALVVEALVNAAIDGNIKATEIILERVDGPMPRRDDKPSNLILGRTLVINIDDSETLTLQEDDWREWLTDTKAPLVLGSGYAGEGGDGSES